MKEEYTTACRWSARRVAPDYIGRVRNAALGRWPVVLRTLGIPGSLLDGKESRCHKCGGHFRHLDDGRGSFVCVTKGTRGLGRARDGFDLLSHLGGMSFAQAVRAVGGALGVSELESDPDAAVA